jgi:hypothetical protein
LEAPLKLLIKLLPHDPTNNGRNIGRLISYTSDKPHMASLTFVNYNNCLDTEALTTIPERHKLLGGSDQSQMDKALKAIKEIGEMLGSDRLNSGYLLGRSLSITFVLTQ